jgi:hypothetical protein
MDLKKKLAMVIATGALTFGVTGVASATGTLPEEPPAKVKCNSGRGNLSETTPATDCDPGKSGLVNNGGD